MNGSNESDESNDSKRQRQHGRHARATKGTPMKLTVGLIGCGEFAKLHLDGLVRCAHVGSVVAADPDEAARESL